MQHKIIEDCKASATTDDTKKVVELLGSATSDDKRIVIAVYEILYNLYLENITLGEIVSYMKVNHYDMSLYNLYRYTIDKSGDESVLNVAYALVGVPLGGITVASPEVLKAATAAIGKLTAWWESLEKIKIADLKSKEYVEKLAASWAAVSHAAILAFTAALIAIPNIDPYGSEWVKNNLTAAKYDNENFPVKIDNMTLLCESSEENNIGINRKSEALYNTLKYLMHRFDIKYDENGHMMVSWHEFGSIVTVSFRENSIFSDITKTLIKSYTDGNTFSNNRNPVIATCLSLPQLDNKPFLNDEYNKLARWALNTWYAEEDKDFYKANINIDATDAYVAIGWFFRNVYADLTNIQHMTDRLNRVFSEVKENIFSVITHTYVSKSEKAKATESGQESTTPDSDFGTIAEFFHPIIYLKRSIEQQTAIFKDYMTWIPDIKAPNGVLLYTYERLVNEYCERRVEDIKSMDDLIHMQFLIGFIQVLAIKWRPSNYNNFLAKYNRIHHDAMSFKEIYKRVYVWTSTILKNSHYTLNNGGKLLWDTI